MTIEEKRIYKGLCFWEIIYKIFFEGSWNRSQ